jgi:hypothetical protein
MRWHMRVVLTAGSTGSALRAVRPFQPSHHAGVSDATSFTPQADIQQFRNRRGVEILFARYFIAVATLEGSAFATRDRDTSFRDLSEANQKSAITQA